ncbi:hypothetical protein [Actinomadura terrae]|uniref:hypothetical protein n=1 Tax=Actinomadura terrae TaxID=604353 RepID=UPI001FA77F10|nr:hypothetical protein [Actinomadura terrae]
MTALDDLLRRLYEAAATDPPDDATAALADTVLALPAWTSLDGTAPPIGTRAEPVPLDHIAETDPANPAMLGWLAARFRGRHARTGDAADLARVRELAAKAVQRTGTDDPSLGLRLNNLAGVLRTLYGTTGDPRHLDLAAEHYRRAVEATAPDDPDHPVYEGNLAVVLSDRYDLLGDPGDLDAAITAARRVVAHPLIDGDDLARNLGNLAVYLSDRFDRSGDLGDLSQALAHLAEALRVPGLDAPDRARLQSNAAMLLLDRYERTGNLPELEVSVRYAMAAVDTADGDSAEGETADGETSRDPELPGYLNNLGNSLRLRYEHESEAGPASGQGGVTHLRAAIRAYRRATETVSADSPYLPKFLKNLGDALLDLAAVLSSAEMFDEAVGALERAVEVTPAGSPDLPGRLSSLATALRYRLAHGGPDGDRDRAVGIYREVCRVALDLQVEIALTTAETWGRWAAEREAWAEAAEAYDAGLLAAARLHRLQPLAEYRRTWLRSSRGMAAEASRVQVALGRLADAAVTAERGRALLLADALDRDRADLDALGSARPALAERYLAAVGRLRAMEDGTLVP